MNTQDKKILATKVMGWEYHEYMSWYNPHTNPDQFLALLKALTPEQRRDVTCKIFVTHEDYNELRFEEFHDIEGIIWMTQPENMPKVIAAILTILEDK